MRRVGRDTDQASTDPQCTLTTKSNGAGHPGTSADNENMSEITFVRGASPPRQHLAQQFIVDAAKCW
jgi:hypothetical protein